jgi:hypothetical protein
MLKEYKTQALLGIWGGVLFFCVGFVISAKPCMSYLYFGRAIMAGGYILCVCGGFMYARGKGHGWLMGLWSILGPLGLLILYVLKDKSRMILKQRKKELG